MIKRNKVMRMITKIRQRRKKNLKRARARKEKLKNKYKSIAQKRVYLFRKRKKYYQT
jgi:hypothetical protein